MLEDECRGRRSLDFGRYRTYFADRQNLLAHQNERLPSTSGSPRNDRSAYYQTICTRADVFLLV